MKSSFITPLILTAALHGTPVFANENVEAISCPKIGVSKQENILAGCMAERDGYLAVMTNGQCSVRDALSPLTGKKGSSRVADVTYQVFLKDKKQMTHYKYISFSSYGNIGASCEALTKYAGKNILKQLDQTK